MHTPELEQLDASTQNRLRQQGYDETDVPGTFVVEGCAVTLSLDAGGWSFNIDTPAGFVFIGHVPPGKVFSHAFGKFERLLQVV